ncbi:hypothetical protein [Burkholderia gladioli]|uniref:hypothetical protein n=1 Tax=Burkholderia gladioli TaxID=28095 RepID=UPI001640A8A0|nr:hypothetical protein [Burkholderia gladioli]
MTEASTISLREKFKSLNGGISMCLNRLSDSLVAFGLDNFYQNAHDALTNSTDISTRNDWHFLRLGIESLGNENIEILTSSLKDPYTRLKALTEEHQQFVTSVEEAEKYWEVAAECARQQLAIWEPWAIKTEIAWKKSGAPWLHPSQFDSLLGLRVSMKIRSAKSLITSPQQLKKNLPSFNTNLKSIRNIISRTYLENELPNQSIVYDLDIAISNLMKHQRKFESLEKQENEISDKLTILEREYENQKKQLTTLLNNLPDTAQWALFLIFQKEYQNTSDVKKI